MNRIFAFFAALWSRVFRRDSVKTKIDLSARNAQCRDEFRKFSRFCASQRERYSKPREKRKKRGGTPSNDHRHAKTSARARYGWIW